MYPSLSLSLYLSIYLSLFLSFSLKIQVWWGTIFLNVSVVLSSSLHSLTYHFCYAYYNAFYLYLNNDYPLYFCFLLSITLLLTYFSITYSLTCSLLIHHFYVRTVYTFTEFFCVITFTLTSLSLSLYTKTVFLTLSKVTQE